MLYSSQVNSRVVTITPEIAKEWLANNKTNRKVTRSVVRQYADDIRAGNWYLNGESIKIAHDNTLIDGQHRLLAVIEAQMPIQSMVVSGIDGEVMPTVDIGKKRNTSDLLSLKGVSYPVQAASTLAVLVNLRDGTNLSRSHVTALMSQEYLTANPDVLRSVKFTYENKGSMRWRPQYAAAHYLFSLRNSSAADSFFVRLFSGANLSDADAVYRLREKLIKEESNRKKHTRNDVMFWFIRSWNAERQGQTVEKLHGMGKSNSFPEIE